MKSGRLNEPSFYMDAVFPLCVACILSARIGSCHPSIDADKDLESEARKRVSIADVAEKSSTEATFARGFFLFGRYFQSAVESTIVNACVNIKVTVLYMFVLC